MHTLEPELTELHAAEVIDDDTAMRTVAHERGTVFSLFLELRIALYVAVAMITTGAGLLLRDNLDRIGPITIIWIFALLAAVCYAIAIRSLRLGRERFLGGDYLLLLGALLLSMDLGYAETQFHWLGDQWSLHLLVLAIWHAVAAYLFKSRLVLSVSLTSLAAWFGLNISLNQLFDWQRDSIETGARGLLCAAVILVWRYLHRRFNQAPLLLSVFEHFAINLAFWSALTWCTTLMRWPGMVVATLLAAVVIPRGLRTQDESYVIYGVAYTALAACIVLGQTVGEPLLASLLVLMIVATASVLLWRFHRQLKHGDPL